MSDAVVRSVGGYTFEVTTKESHRDELTITSHPVEQGAAITDHAFRQPSQLTVVAASSPKYLADVSLHDMYGQMLVAQQSREPLEVQTGKRFYENMLIRSLSVETDQATENIISITMTLQEIILVETFETTMPSSANRSDQASNNGVTDTGAKSVTAYTGTAP